jgi:ABC-type anion transport system duplicated permease subunit
VPEPDASEVQRATGKLNRHKAPTSTIDQIPAELIKAGSRTIRSEIHKFINSTWNKEEFPEEWQQSLYLFIRWVIKQVVNFICNIPVGVEVTISINIHNHNQPIWK